MGTDFLNSGVRYQKRLFLLIIVFTWVLALSFFVIQYVREKEYKVNLLNEKLQDINHMLISQIDVDSINGNFADMGFRFVQPSDSLRISIVLMDGSVVYDSNNETVKENHRNRPEINNAIKNGEGYTIFRQSAVDNSEYFYSATLANGYIVRTAIPYNQSALNDMLKVDTAYIWITVFIAVVLSIVAYFASCRIGMSIKLLRDFAVKAEKRELKDNEKYDFPNDELGEISSHIINMYRDMNKALLERDKSMNDLITEEREKNRIKNQLTSNINHELKTPVHTIQACIETIINNRYRMTKNQEDELMRTCHDNVKRLCDLLRDITTLTDINDNSCQIAKEQLNVSNLVASVCRDISSRQAEHSIRINNYLPDGIEISGNKSLVESIFSNLINNAVLYSGGRDIFIKLKSENADDYCFEVSDNGIGVEPRHLPRLFERFYRVDDGRSRAYGGTGLGLAIVKNAVQFHGGTISVDSPANRGLIFTFTLHK